MRIFQGTSETVNAKEAGTPEGDYYTSNADGTLIRENSNNEILKHPVAGEGHGEDSLGRTQSNRCTTCFGNMGRDRSTGVAQP